MYLVSSLLFLCAGGAINASMLADVMKEMPPLINENDLHISQVRYPAFLSSSTHDVSFIEAGMGILQIFPHLRIFFFNASNLLQF